MITCFFDHKAKANLRHITASSIAFKNGKILLVKRQPKARQGGKWCLPGGFLQLDETTKECALREFTEETGYSGKVPSLFLINDNPHRKNEIWQIVDFVYLIKPGRKVQEPDGEQTEVKWFWLNKLPAEKDFAFDHFDVIQLFKKHLIKSFKLPIPL